MLLYLLSLIISLSTLILTIINAFSKPDALIFKVFGIKEICVTLIISVILLTLGIISDKR